MITNDYKQKWFSWIITNKSESHKWLQIKVIVTNGYKFSSNINEVSFKLFILFFFVLEKDLTRTKKHETACSEQK